MNLTTSDYQLFQRDEFTFKQLKARHSEAELADIKADYKEHWQSWKDLQLATAALLPTELAMPKPKIESWPNGWNLRNHFWAAYRSEGRQEENACLAALLNRKQYQVYLMFQHYKSDERKGDLADYNRLLDAIPRWATGVDISDYYIWPQLEPELVDHLPLREYLSSPDRQAALRAAMGDRSFQLGKLIFERDLSAAEEVTAATLLELWPLYRELSIE